MALGDIPFMSSTEDGSKQTADAALTPEAYRELRRLAAYYLRMEREGHTLQPTALVHEAYMRVCGAQPPEFADSREIIYMLAAAMRRTLVDYARQRCAEKRSLPESELEARQDDAYKIAADLLTVHEALDELRAVNERQVRVVELRYFAGMTEEEAAAVLGLSRETVKRDWRAAREFLHDKLTISS